MRKYERFFSFLVSTLLAFLTGFSVPMCIATAFDLAAVDAAALAAWCGGCAAISSAFFTFKLGLIPPIACAALGVCDWFFGGLAVSSEALIYRVTDSIGKTYGFKPFSWSGSELSGANMTAALCIIAAVIILTVSRTVCRRKGMLPVFPAVLLPLSVSMLITNRVSDPIWLFVLLLGMVLLILTQSTRRRDAAQADRLTALALIPTALGLGLLFLALPQEGYVRQDAQESPFLSFIESAREQLSWTGISSEDSQVDLTLTGPLRQRNTPVMEVTATEGGMLYLRGRSYDTYTGTGWTSSGQESDLPWLNAYALGNAPTVSIRTRSTLPIRFVPYYLTADAMNAADIALENREGLTQYSYALYTTPQFVDIMISDQDLQLANGGYLQLPESTAAWAKPLAQKITDGAPAHRAAAFIKRYVQNSASYDLQTGYMSLDSQDFAQWFLQRSNTGYCVHFATAATVLLRACGINARYVTGYLIEAKPGETATVLEKHAHAWTEYYVPDVGWVILDATGMGDIQYIPPGTYNPATEPDPTEPPSRPTEPPATAAPTQPSTPKPQGQSKQDASWLIPAGIVLALILGLPVQWQLRLLLRRRKRAAGRINQRVVAAWAELSLLCRLSGDRPDQAFLQLAQKARFSQHTLDRRDLILFDSAINRQISKLRTLPLHKRLLHRLLYAAY